MNLIIYSNTIKQGELWAACNVVHTPRVPIYSSPEHVHPLIGLRDKVIIIVGRPPWVAQLDHCKGRNVLISIDGD